MKKKHLLFLLLPLILLTGCWDLNENERMYYAYGLGVDYQNDEFVIWIQLINFANIAKTEQSSIDGIQSQVSSASGKTMDEALFKLYHAIDERVYWGHLSLLIFSEEALKKERVNSVLNTLTRYTDTRYNIWVYCTDQPLDQFFITVPVLNKGISLTVIGDPRNSYEQESFIDPIDVRRLIIALDEPGHDANIPYISLKKDWQTQDGVESTIKINGVGVVTTKEFKGYIKNDDVSGLQWMSNQAKRGEITTKYKEKYLTVTLRNINVKIKPVVNGNNVKFDINIEFNATLASFEENLTSTEIKKQVIEEMKKEIKQTYQAGLEKNMDIYQFSEVLYRKDVKTWKKLQQNGNIKLDNNTIGKININVEKLTSGRKSFKETIN
ncbi:Ger(x)C family spore germination protein [Ureibacillus sp. Re31]|uniref:Ger(X)C family spore germination protein n=1 Tax=Ureibacillus galli TaxID=2762222 RepID=A0ABR8XFK4_9BACL|nr:Ger(x)C family spore germination protein [Ureibacillus galli]MBD8028010.1 Ger(x)C family spore germination protein [Ureibacillus galli]